MTPAKAGIAVLSMKNIDKELDRYFRIFDSSISLVEELIKNKQYPQEVLVLLCARLDALASDAAAEGTPNSQAFSAFVTHYGVTGSCSRA